MLHSFGRMSARPLIASYFNRSITIIIAETLTQFGFQLDHVCVAAEPVSKRQDGAGVDLDYIAIKLWSETLDFSLLTMSEVA